MANAHKKSNWLRKIKINEVWCTEENEIQESMAKAFQSLLSKPSDWHLSLAGLDFDRLGNEDVAKLEVAFSEEEVFLALCELNGDKVPRLDEFTIAFWQILDAVLIANEAIDSMLKMNENRVLCKLDIEKGIEARRSPSPYLFVIGMKALTNLINRAEASQEQTVYLSSILMWFEVISGLKINLDNSKILPVGRVDNVKELASELVASWDGVEERFWKRLAMWKRQFISKGKRITLIRSTLSTIPIYYMSMLRMPRVVRLRLKKIQRDFLWGGRKLEKKSHLVKRSIVYSDETKGGLGVRCLSKLNKALLGNGRRVRFWKDRWCGDEALSISFPSLYALVTSKEAWVAEV
ncbi:putative ribonuclease H protein [Vitis vinifera]|uniref:Putative ribonuclease H protein n=1 Tax=Vitis vinifera TaxID=29760 RepID=A0A438KN37_VITVI|nr:putative ribonuclease H protein [Vitis vinifera]